MKTFQLKIPETCRSISDTLYVRGVLWNHKWFVLGENGYEELLTFQRNGALIIFFNDKEEKAAWVYNNKTKSLALRGSRKIKISRMLRPFFWDGCLLVFKLNMIDEYLFLVSAGKAHTLDINPLDSFETYASNSIQKKKSDKRRKPVDENENQEKMPKPLDPEEVILPEIMPEIMPDVEDSKQLVAMNPGPVAHNFQPAPQPEEPLPAEPLPEKEPLPAAVPNIKVEKRIQQALEKQQAMLEKKWKEKLEAEKEKFKAALWVEKNEVDRRVKRALREQAGALNVKAQKFLKEQKQQWKTSEQAIRDRRTAKIKEEVAKLQRKNQHEVEEVRLKEETKYRAQIDLELHKQKKIFDSQLKIANRKVTALEAELLFVQSLQDVADGKPENKDGKRLEEFRKRYNDWDRQRKELEKELEVLNNELQAEKKRHITDMKNEKARLLKALNEKDRDLDRASLYKKRVLIGFDYAWELHSLLAEEEIDNRLKSAWGKDPSHKFYCKVRNILLPLIPIFAVLLFFNNTDIVALRTLGYQVGLPFLFHLSFDAAFWGLFFPLACIVVVLVFLTVDNFSNKNFLRKKLRKDYDAEFFKGIMLEKKPNEKKTSGAPKTPAHGASLFSTLRKYLRSLRS